MIKNDKLLLILETIPHSKTLTDVANRLYFTQPYISKVIRQAEQEYQVQLVNRAQAPISLTPAGKSVRDGLERLRYDELQLNKNVQTIRRRQQLTITIALSTLLETKALPKIAGELHRLFPQLSFRLLNQLPNATEDDLLTQNVDILVGPTIDSPLFYCHEVNQAELAILIPKSAHRGANLTALKKDQPITAVTLPRESLLQQRINGFWEKQGVSLRPICEVPNMRLAILTAVELGAITVARPDLIKATLQGQTKDYRLLRIAKEQLMFESTVSVSKAATPLVQQVAQKLAQIVASADCN
ncbi:LysR family transcriptional regulator [Limosilactobacillus sp.]|uniref:LysR family transcriptional regulator n=1 Tax=Limosilactobacillus sp. TaxID=2773925 RepID=UPI003F021294